MREKADEWRDRKPKRRTRRPVTSSDSSGEEMRWPADMLLARCWLLLTIVLTSGEEEESLGVDDEAGAEAGMAVLAGPMAAGADASAGAGAGAGDGAGPGAGEVRRRRRRRCGGQVALVRHCSSGGNDRCKGRVRLRSTV